MQKKREKYLNDLLETDPDEYNKVMSDLAKVNMIVGPTGITSQVPPSMGFTQTVYDMPKAPPSMLTSNFEEIDGRKSLGDPAALEILGQKYKDTLTFPGDGGGGGDGPRPYLPINYNTGAAEIVEPYTNDFTYDKNAFGPGGDSADVTRASYIFNKGGRVPAMEGGIMGTRARRAMGGIMNRVDQRQGYFLGGIGKAIKGAVSGVVDATKKVLKSDVGKMALLYAGGSYLGGTQMFGGTGNLSFMERLASPSNFKNLFMNSDKGILSRVKGLKDSYDGMGKFGKLATMGGIGLGLSMIPGLNKPKPNEDTYADRGGSLIDPITGQPAKPAEMRASLNDALANANGDPDKIKQIQNAYAFLPPDERLGTYSPYRTYGVKDGGRIGYAEGKKVDYEEDPLYINQDYDEMTVPLTEYEKFLREMTKKERQEEFKMLKKSIKTKRKYWKRSWYSW